MAETIADITKIINTSTGKSRPDLLLKNASLVNVFSGEVYRTNVAIVDGLVAGCGDYEDAGSVDDLEGCFLLPGLIDGHIHIESSMLSPARFAEAVLPHGTTTVIADPHEIVNVCGMEGFRYMVESSRNLPVDFFYMVPSCVPATNMETSGAEFGPDDIEEAWRIHPESPGLAEMMNFPGVVAGDESVLAKIRLAIDRGKKVDGHAPLLAGKSLAAYVAAGIRSDHESTTPEEVIEKIRLGMKIAVREGSAAKNLAAILPVIGEKNFNMTYFCSDDRSPGDIYREGDIICILRQAVSRGFDPVRAVRMATINTALHYNLSTRGAIAPGYIADIVAVRDLKDFRVERVYKNGTLMVKNNTPLFPIKNRTEVNLERTVKTTGLHDKLKAPVPPENATTARVIEVFADTIITKRRDVTVDSLAVSDGISLVAVIERHGINGNLAIGYVAGFGRLNGALASTVAHDSHNLIVVGSSVEEMKTAAEAVVAMEGGQVVVSGKKVLASLALPIAGLMSDDDAPTVSAAQTALHCAAEDIGCILPEPFVTMSFISLPVIPHLKITDKGLVDVDLFRRIDLFF